MRAFVGFHGSGATVTHSSEDIAANGAERGDSRYADRQVVAVFTFGFVAVATRKAGGMKKMIVSKSL